MPGRSLAVPAGSYNIRVDQGSTFHQALTWKPSGVAADLSGWTARMQVRTTIADAAVVITLTTENGRITLGDGVGNIALDISATDTTGLPEGYRFYDLELIDPDGKVKRVLQGRFIVSAETTR